MQAKTATETASKWLQDESKAVWNDAKLLDWLKSALHRLCDDRPDILMTTAGLIDRSDEIDDLASVNAELPGSIDGRFKNTLAHLICHFCYLEDADSTANLNLANTHFELYQRAIT